MLARMGLRNLGRNKLRTGLTGVMLGFGTALVLFMVGLGEGQYKIFIEGMTNTFTGNFQVLDPAFHDKPSMAKVVHDPRAIIERLERIPGVRGVTPRIETAGLLAKEQRTTSVVVMAVDAKGERATTWLPEAVKRGTWFEPNHEGKAVVLGAGVMKRLKAELGDEVTFIGQAADGSMAAELFRVVGVYDSGAEIDGMLMLMSFNHAQELFVLDNRAHRLVGTVTDPRALPQIMAQGKPMVPKQYRFDTWDALEPGIAQAITTDRTANYITLAFIVMVVLLGVANTMLMAVFERTREFGIMLALGTRPGQITALTLLEVLWLSMVSVGAGLALGVALTEGLPIPMGEPVEFAGVVLTEVQGTTRWESLIIVPVVIIASAMLSALYPARRAAQLDPLAALRQE